MAQSSSPPEKKTLADRKVELEKFLLATFDEESGINNTRLHKAILGHLNPPQQPAAQPTSQEILEKIKKLLAMDKELVSLGGQSIINYKAFQNTALTLAIKHGLIDVALVLLDHPNIDVNARDKSNNSPLQLASMLRQNQLIQTLLSKKAGVEGTPGPGELYHFQPNQQDVENLISIANYKISGQGYAYRFLEGPHDKPVQISWDNPILNSFADLFVFYLPFVLPNLGWVTQSQDLNKLAKTTTHSLTEDTFRHSFIVGIPMFVAAREQIVPDAELLSSLGYGVQQSVSPLQKSKDATFFKSAPSTAPDKENLIEKKKGPAI
jgi:hypothetical protein